MTLPRKAAWDDPTVPPLPKDLPAVCCGHCQHHERVIAFTGVCRWPAPESLPRAYGPRLTRVDEGASCPCFEKRRTKTAAIEDFDLPLFREAV